jgi:hypothetical protein
MAAVVILFILLYCSWICDLCLCVDLYMTLEIARFILLRHVLAVLFYFYALTYVLSWTLVLCLGGGGGGGGGSREVLYAEG